MNNQTNANNNSYLLNGKCSISEIQRNITMPILILLAIPSLVCFLFIFYYMIKLRQQLIFNCINNHIVLLILISDFLLISTELPISLYYLALGNVRTVKICIFWVYWDYTLETVSLFLTMYASIERYLLVFRKHYIKRHQFLLHYIPMSFAGLYIPILYLYFIVLSPCAQHQSYDITAFTCNGPCFFSYVSVNTYDTIVDTMLPCFTLLIFNLLIIIRVTIIRGKALKSASLMKILRKNRRMILQLVGFSLMSLIAWMPWVVIIIVQDFFQPTFGNWFITHILHYLPYVTTSASPFLALIGLPEIRKNFKKIKYPISKITGPTSIPAIVIQNDLIANTHF
jgi:hypothetical protein